MERISVMHEKTMISFPWTPDFVEVHSFKYGICTLCEVKKNENKNWDNSTCIHCKSLTKFCINTYGERNKKG